MQEVEVKILDIDVNEIRKKLLNLGAKKILDSHLNFVLMDTADHDFKKKRQLLIVRKSDQKTTLCFKDKVEKGKVRTSKEYEVVVDDYEATIKLLLSLGYVIRETREKHRESYQLDKALYEFDSIPGMPTYLEVESDNEKDVKKAVEKIGFKMEDTVTLNAEEVLQKYERT